MLNTRKEVYVLHQKLAQMPHHTQLENIIQHTNEITRKVHTTIKETRQRKLKILISHKSNNVSNTTYMFHAHTINLTAITFDTDEIELLNKGLKHNIKPNNNKKQMYNTILDAETKIQKTHLNMTVKYYELTLNIK